MRKSFGKIIIGMLFVFIDIRIGVIDIFADPIGYWFIYFGVIGLIGAYPVGKRAKNAAVMLAFMSLPTIFIPANALLHPLSFLGVYMPLLKILTIIIVLFLFQLMLQIADTKGYSILYKQTRLFSFIYVVTMILIFSLQLLPTPFTETGWKIYIVTLSFITMGLQIIFLGWLFRFRMFQKG